MNRWKGWLQLRLIPLSIDGALLLLRLWLGLGMLWLHGWPKVAQFSERVAQFRDPLGVGSTASLSLAILGEVVASIFLIAGLGTRWAALLGVLTMAVVFFLVHGASFVAARGSGPELSFLYLGGYLTLLLAGGGRFAWDRRLGI